METAAGPDTEPIAAPPAYAVAAEEHEAEVPDAWAASEDPLASGSGAEPGEAGESGLDARAPTEEFASPATGDQPGEGSAVAGAPPESAGGIFVIYRSAADLAKLSAAPWAWDYLDPLAHETRPTEEKYYQFRVLCTQQAAVQGFTEFTVTADDKVQQPVMN